MRCESRWPREGARSAGWYPRTPRPHQPTPPKPLTTPRSLPPTHPKEASFTEGRAQRIDVGQFLWVLLLVWIGKEEAVRDTR